MQRIPSFSLVRSFKVSALGVSASFALLSGCTSIDSTDLNTQGIHPDITITSEAGLSGSRLDVVLHTQSVTDFVELEGGDTLTVTVGEETKDLEETKVLGITTYTAALEVDTPGTEISVAFTRPNEESAPASTVTLTETLELTAPAAAQTFSRADNEIVITWDSTGDSEDPVTVSLVGQCIKINPELLLIEEGVETLTLPAGSIEKADPVSPNDTVEDSCDVSLRVSRTKLGALDPAFGGGAIRHSAQATTTFTSNP